MLCAVELLERFAYFSLMEILMFYLTQQRGMDQSAAASSVGNFLALVYLAPLPGALLADRVLGQVRAVLLGAALLAGGYAMLVFHDSGTFYAALLALIAGYGLFKPAIPAVLANSYPRLDASRETAFIVFFLAIQFGAFLAPLASAAAQMNFGWAGSFATSAAAMTLAVLLLLGGRRRLIQAHWPPDAAAEPPPRWSALLVIYLICTLHSVAANSLLVSLPLFARAHVDLTLGGRFANPIPEGSLRSSEVVFQALLVPLVLLGLFFLRRRRVELSVLAKIGIGMVLVVLPCLLMVRASLGAEHGQPVSMLWVLGAYLALALPSLFLTPIVMVLVSQLVPRRHLSTVFAMWFAVTTVSNNVASVLVRMQSGLPEPIWYGGLGLLALLATGLWISQVRRLEAALRPA